MISVVSLPVWMYIWPDIQYLLDWGKFTVNDFLNFYLNDIWINFNVIGGDKVRKTESCSVNRKG